MNIKIYTDLTAPRNNSTNDKICIGCNVSVHVNNEKYTLKVIDRYNDIVRLQKHPILTIEYFHISELTFEGLNINTPIKDIMKFSKTPVYREHTTKQ